MEEFREGFRSTTGVDRPERICVAKVSSVPVEEGKGGVLMLASDEKVPREENAP